MHVWPFFGKVTHLALIMTLTIWWMVFSKVSHSNMWVSSYQSFVNASDCISDDLAHFTRPANCLWWAFTRKTTTQCSIARYDDGRSCIHCLWLCRGLSSLSSCIAHIEVCQVRFEISLKNTQTEENGDFNYRHFYRHIVELIEDFASRSRRTIIEGLEHVRLSFTFFKITLTICISNRTLFKNENGMW
jgi:hypothetical protein